MSENTLIEWADHTFNPWEGCQKTGPGCNSCYAEARNARFGGGQAVNWGPGAPRRRTSPANWRKPVQWDANASAFQAEHGRRQRVFCASLADVFDNAVPAEWLVDLLGLVRDTPHLDWLLLTKRIGNWKARLQQARDATLDSAMIDCWLRGMAPSNVWLGATVVNQIEADRDIPKLLAVPAQVRFLSIEPMLGPIELSNVTRRADAVAVLGKLALDGIHWMIVGGESGPKARPMHPDWARSLRDQCAAASVPFLFKQWGEWTEVDTGLPQPLVANFGDPEFYDAASEHDGFLSWDGHFVTHPDLMNDDVPYRGLVRVGKKAAGRLLDGREHNGFPKGAA